MNVPWEQEWVIIVEPKALALVLCLKPYSHSGRTKRKSGWDHSKRKSTKLICNRLEFKNLWIHSSYLHAEKLSRTNTDGEVNKILQLGMTLNPKEFKCRMVFVLNRNIRPWPCMKDAASSIRGCISLENRVAGE